MFRLKVIRFEVERIDFHSFGNFSAGVKWY